jgi:hypothetical protein
VTRPSRWTGDQLLLELWTQPPPNTGPQAGDADQRRAAASRHRGTPQHPPATRIRPAGTVGSQPVRPIGAPRPTGSGQPPRPLAPPGAKDATATAATPDASHAATPDARRAARRFLDTCLEILNGYRPANQLRPLLLPADAATVIEHLAATVIGPPNRQRRPSGRSADRFRLRRLRVSEPLPGVVEAAAVLGISERARALAFRLERHQGRWFGTVARIW